MCVFFFHAVSNFYVFLFIHSLLVFSFTYWECMPGTCQKCLADGTTNGKPIHGFWWQWQPNHMSRCLGGEPCKGAPYLIDWYGWWVQMSCGNWEHDFSNSHGWATTIFSELVVATAPFWISAIAMTYWFIMFVRMNQELLTHSSRWRSISSPIIDVSPKRSCWPWRVRTRSWATSS